MADNLLYEMSQMSETTTEPFVKREVVYILDQQNTSYNGQITFESSQIANSGKWASWTESWLELPFVVAWQTSEDTTGTANSFQCGMKNGWHHIIDSIQVDYNNTNVIQLTSFSNMWMNFKLLSTWSQDDVAKYGATMNFFPDTSTSMKYSATAGKNGDGTSNNVVYPLTAIDYGTTTYKGATFNAGLRQRLLNCGYETTATSFGGCVAFNSAPEQTGMNYWTTTGAGANRIYYLNLMATIPLKFLHDFFDKMPLIKGSFLKLTINYNSSYNVITSVSTTSLALTTATLTTGRTNPVMVASGAANNPNAGVVAAANGTMSVYSGVSSVKVGATTISHGVFTTCRLYCVLYTMNPVFEDQYLSLNPTKEIVYRDIYNFNVIKKQGGGDITTLLTNGITNPKTLLLIPVVNGDTAGTNGAAAFSPLSSPFASEPATTSPLLAIKEFNVQVSGLNIYPANIRYDYETFLSELSKTGVNGGTTTGLASGLIGQHDFQTAYRFYLVDLSRRLPLDDTVAKSIQIQGTLNVPNTKYVDLYCFIEYERRITLDMATGAIIQV